HASSMPRSRAERFMPRHSIDHEMTILAIAIWRPATRPGPTASSAPGGVLRADRCPRGSAPAPPPPSPPRRTRPPPATETCPAPAACNSPRTAILTDLGTRLVRVTHPFHPLSGRQLVCVGERCNRYGTRLLLRVDEDRVCSVPRQWTDVVAPDPEVVIGE